MTNACRWSRKVRHRRVAVGLLVVAAASCATDRDLVEPAPSAGPTARSAAELFADDAGSTIFYDDLRDQIIDSDVVLVGRAVDVVAGGSEPGDESGPVDYLYNVVEVDEVLYRSPAVEVQPGDRLRVVRLAPAGRSIDDLRAGVADDVPGVFLLFNSANLRKRLGEPASPDANDTWLLQTAGSAAFEGPTGDVVASGSLVPAAAATRFADLVEEVRATADDLISGGVRQPDDVLGMRDATG